MLKNPDDGIVFSERLKKREIENRLRTLQPVDSEGGKTTLRINGVPCLNFCSNDYLGLSVHPEVIQQSINYTRRFGASASSSRLVSGSLTIHHELEDQLASLCRRQAALLFGSGFQANATLLPALAGRGDVILADKQIHNSIIQGGILSRAKFRRFRHNDCNHLEELLKRFRKESSSGSCWVVTESLFSMGGDRAPLGHMVELCRQYGAYLMVDDAHAFGVLGEKGLGLAAGYDEIDLILGTFGKAGGGFGAFVLCSELLKEVLVNFCNGLIYSTAPAPSLVGAASAAVQLIPGMNRERERLLSLSDQLRYGLEAVSLSFGESRSHIIPILLDDEEMAVRLSDNLMKNQLYVQAIRPPTVEQSRLRVTVTAHHTKMEIERLLEAIEGV